MEVVCSLTNFKVPPPQEQGLERAPFMDRHLTGLPGPHTFGGEPPHKEGLF